MNDFLHFRPGDFMPSQHTTLQDALLGATAAMPRDVTCRDISLRDFAKEAWKIVEPGTEFKDNWHIGAICDHLEAVYYGDIERLLISMPPRHMKSLLVAVMWPCWVWTKDPCFKWIFSSYAQNLSTRDSLKCRNIIQSAWYQLHWGDLYQLKRDENLKTKFTNTREGYRIATSVDGSATGEGGDCIVGDDLLKAKDAHSENARRTAKVFWRETMHTRINNPQKPKKVLMAQRLHEDDVTGAMLKEGGYVHLCIQAEYNPKEVSTLPPGAINPLGFKDPRSKVGALLCPNRYNEKAIEEMKTALGPWAYAAQAQQVPAPAGGGIFKKTWWNRWNFSNLPSTFDEVFMSWDMSFKKTEQGSYVVGQVWGKDGPNFYLLHQYRARASFVETCDAFKTMCDDWPEAFAKYIEEKANGAAVISQFENTINGMIPLLPSGSKEARAHAITPMVRAGNVYIPEVGLFPWVEDYVKEHTVFPNGAYDDQVDCTSQAIGEYIKDPVARLRM